MSPDEGYPAIGDYGFIGDARTGALVSRWGSVEWLCLPQFFSRSLFASMLDRERGGFFRIAPAEAFDVSRRYVGESAVLETTFRTARGVVRLTDCLVVLSESERLHELQPSRELLRKVEVLEGEVTLDVVVEPRPDYGRRLPRLRWQRGMGWVFDLAGGKAVLNADLALQSAASDTRLAARATLGAGSVRYVSLAVAERDVLVAPPLGEHAERRLDATLEWWRGWAGQCRYRGPYHDYVMRSAVTLRMLDYALSGAVLAAPTTSLPEALGGGRNWDYRFCWLRDAAFTLRAFNDLGYTGAADDFFSWLLHATRLTWPNLKVLYDVHGKQPAAEEVLHHLSGYRGSRPVRISNGARDQLQLDVYGELMLAAYDYARRDGRISRFEAKLLKGFADTVCKLWREPDHSIWEIRGQPRHYTYSKLMCWAALDALVRLYEEGHLEVDVEPYRREREQLGKAIEERGYNRRLGAYVAVFDGDQPDAALLQLARVGYVAADDPRMVGTYELIRRELTDDGLVKRYPDGFDGMSGQEAAFGVCSFWMVDYLVRARRREEARALFEHLLSYANDLGLYAEEIEPRTGTMLGNFPQAFTHVGLIDAALALAGAESGEERHARA